MPSTPIRLTRKQLTDMGACKDGLEWFNTRAGGTDQLVYPRGFDNAEIRRLAMDHPHFLKWMAKRGIIPGMDLNDARRVVLGVLQNDPDEP